MRCKNKLEYVSLRSNWILNKGQIARIRKKKLTLSCNSENQGSSKMFGLEKKPFGALHHPSEFLTFLEKDLFFL